ncbi:prepilin peptidase [Actinomycetaceae bacterium WB03_NA08]|uniref:Prepilin peptidase n=1 Tax=Scrofimicrobium canadense TaxID=2652290 RepID=A0A6N7VQA5_9ACTO|nr:A24 family peptidase [Scrofimicrobium canadense]MSS83924.1 prepilin peptidase [Scrofimicrobium canadense]
MSLWGSIVCIFALNLWWLTRSAHKLSLYSPRAQSPVIVGGAVLAGFATIFVRREAEALAVATLGWAAAWIDGWSRRLPTTLTLLMSLEVITLSLFSPAAAQIDQRLIGASIWTAFTLIGFLMKSVGRGDVLLAPVLGFWLAPMAVTGLVLAILSAGLWSLICAFRGHSKFAFGPHLIGGAWVTWVMMGA